MASFQVEEELQNFVKHILYTVYITKKKLLLYIVKQAQNLIGWLNIKK